MRVSVVVLNYQYERYLPACLNSALAQTHPDVEVVVVDDGSTDGSRELLAGYGSRVVPVLKPNGGQGSGMNAGFAASTGDVVLFLDADDLLEPTAAATVARCFLTHPGAAWVMFRLRIVDGEGRPTGRERPHRAGVMPNGDLRAHLGRYRCFHWQPTSGNAFSRRALERVLPMPEQDYRISADAYLAGVVPLLGEVRSTDAVEGAYRVHGASGFTSVAVDGAYFRTQIERHVTTHAHAVRLGRDVGVPQPVDVRAPRDAALLAFRLSSLLLDPEQHPFPDDRRGRVAAQGVVASLANRELRWRNRLRRAGWFGRYGLLPRDMAVRSIAESAPDTPARRARAARQ